MLIDTYLHRYLHRYLPTVHLDGEDALVAGCPHRGLDAGLAQQQPAREGVPRYKHYLQYLHNIYTTYLQYLHTIYTKLTSAG